VVMRIAATEAAPCKASDLSPLAHPFGSRVSSSFEPSLGGWATGRGAEPSVSAVASARCITEVLMAA
jgi:hypothetical protein